MTGLKDLVLYNVAEDFGRPVLGALTTLTRLDASDIYGVYAGDLPDSLKRLRIEDPYQQCSFTMLDDDDKYGRYSIRLAILTRLERLCLRNMVVDDVDGDRGGSRSLTALTALTKLTLDDVHGIDTSFVRGLSSLRRLNVVVAAAYDDDDDPIVVPSLPIEAPLESLKLRMSRELGVVTLPVSIGQGRDLDLARFAPTLTRLKLGSMELVEVGDLALLTGLKELCLVECWSDPDSIADVVRHLPLLKCVPETARHDEPYL